MVIEDCGVDRGEQAHRHCVRDALQGVLLFHRLEEHDRLVVEGAEASHLAYSEQPDAAATWIPIVVDQDVAERRDCWRDVMDVVHAEALAVVGVPAEQVCVCGRSPCPRVDDVVDAWVLPRDVP